MAANHGGILKIAIAVPPGRNFPVCPRCLRAKRLVPVTGGMLRYERPYHGRHRKRRSCFQNFAAFGTANLWTIM